MNRAGLLILLAGAALVGAALLNRRAGVVVNGNDPAGVADGMQAAREAGEGAQPTTIEITKDCTAYGTC